MNFDFEISRVDCITVFCLFMSCICMFLLSLVCSYCRALSKPEYLVIVRDFFV